MFVNNFIKITCLYCFLLYICCINNQTMNHIVDCDNGTNIMSPYYTGKENQEEFNCTLCLERSESLSSVMFFDKRHEACPDCINSVYNINDIKII